MYHLVEVVKYNNIPNYYSVLDSFETAEEVLKAQAHKKKESKIFKKKSYNNKEYIIMSEVEVNTKAA